MRRDTHAKSHTLRQQDESWSPTRQTSSSARWAKLIPFVLHGVSSHVVGCSSGRLLTCRSLSAETWRRVGTARRNKKEKSAVNPMRESNQSTGV